MSKQKLPKRNIIPNTADIAPPTKGGHFGIQGKQSSSFGTKPNSDQKGGSGVSVADISVKKEGRIESGNIEQERLAEKTIIPEGTDELARNISSPNLQPRIISFNHAQYVNEEIFEKNGKDKTTAGLNRLNEASHLQKGIVGGSYSHYSPGKVNEGYSATGEVGSNYSVSSEQELGFYNNKEEVAEEKLSTFFGERRSSSKYLDKSEKVVRGEEAERKVVDQEFKQRWHSRVSPEKNNLFSQNQVSENNRPEDNPIGLSVGEKEEPNAERKGKIFAGKKKIKQPLGGFALATLTTVFVFGLMGWAFFGLQSKEEIEVRGVQAINYLSEAKVNLENKDFAAASTNLLSAKNEFTEAQRQLDKLGGKSLNIFKHLPGLSKVSSGKSVVDLGEDLTEAVYELSQISKLLEGVSGFLPSEAKETSGSPGENTSLVKVLNEANKHIKVARQSLLDAEKVSRDIKIEDLPEEYRGKIKTIKELLPLVNKALDDSDDFVNIFLELFGANGPRRYLLVFENNQEMRATGGFIGSYGLLKTANGKIQDLKIEGIYNPDGQLKINVVPPRPIQKISATWSTHDANWWPDFPKSARKIAWFYEKTGGPTVDGVVAITPVVLQKMLTITGPIDMPEYNKIITDKNFIQAIQQEVEVDYDKEENKPKKILADLTPKLFDKFLDFKNPRQIGRAIKVITDSLNEKHILINFNNPKIDKMVKKQGWGGEILETDGDYLAVINSNINGYKTDGVIKEVIEHKAEIKSDGTIIDTVVITRKHNGGQTEYEWWNKVNSDYLRVYVPQGSKLLEVSGQTREFNEERLAYDKLGFQRDGDVEREEKSIRVDPDSGTRIYEENGKTVFANWVYVSPQEQVVLTYKYELPFKVKIDRENKDTYSFLMQKQAGAVNSRLISKIEFPFRWRIHWLEPQGMSLDKERNILSYKSGLDRDVFLGVVFKEK